MSRNFSERLEIAAEFIGIISTKFWKNPEIAKRFIHANIGYETWINREIQQELRCIYGNPTVNLIRFMPDYLVLDLERIMDKEKNPFFKH